MNGRFNDLVRHRFRAYRNGPFRLGHSVIRKFLSSLFGSTQDVRLRSGLNLRLDMTKGNQNGIFWEDGDAEVPLYWAIRELVPLGGTFVDCGANCGLMGLLACQYRHARVIFIEPHPRLARSIQTNINLNSISSRCELIEAAASDQEGEVMFYEDLEADGSHSIHADWGGQKQPLGKVRCVTLQFLIESKAIEKIAFLKIDAEGNDYAVLKGLGTRLQPSVVEVIYAEMSRDRREICDLLQSRGYVGFVARSLRRSQVAKLQRAYEKGGRAAFFQRLEAGSDSHSVVLWCGADSPKASYLNELNSNCPTP